MGKAEERVKEVKARNKKDKQKDKTKRSAKDAKDGTSRSAAAGKVESSRSGGGISSGGAAKQKTLSGAAMRGSAAAKSK